MQKTLKITSVKILKQREGNGLTINIVETDAKGDEASGEQEHTALVHPDLEAAIAKLAPHYALLTNQIPATDIPSNKWKEHDLENKIYVSGYSLSKKSKTEGIMITGHFYNFRQKAVITNTPWEAFGGEEGYPLMSEIGTIVGEIDAEVRAYLDGSKRGKAAEPAPTQSSLEMPTHDEKGQAKANTYPDNDMTNASPEAMARLKADDKPTNRRRAKQTADNPAGDPQ